MEAHLVQAKHNHDFHEAIHDNFDSHYFDWKITALFYTAVHYIRAFIMSQGVAPAESHEEIDKQINPKRTNRTSNISISITCWDNYRNLYQYSRTARYEGFVDIEKFNSDKKIDHAYSGQHLEDIIKYLKDRGLKIQ